MPPVHSEPPQRRQTIKTSRAQRRLRRGECRAGWRSRTSTPTPANCSAPTATPRRRRRTCRGTRRRRHPPASRPGQRSCQAATDHPDRGRGAAVQPARARRPPASWPTDPASSPARRSKTRSATPSPEPGTRCCSPGCSPTTAAGSSTTELGRCPSARLAEAINIRAGTCRFPTCTVPADRCDLDHHQPLPHGPTSGQTWTRSAADTTAAKPSPGSPHQRRPRRRLDHARRRTLPMHRPTTTHRTSRVKISAKINYSAAIDPHTCAARS